MPHERARPQFTEVYEKPLPGGGTHGTFDEPHPDPRVYPSDTIRLTELLEQHLAAGGGAAGFDYPHPDQRVHHIEIYEANFVPRDTDPPNPVNGGMWMRGDLQKYRGVHDGIVDNFAFESQIVDAWMPNVVNVGN